MANPTWPTGLPSPYAASEPTYTPYDNVIRSGMETGPGKVRKRFSGSNERLGFTLHLIASQRTAFWNWYNNTLKEVLPFDWLDLRTGGSATYRFANRPTEKWIAGDTGAGWWEVRINLDLI